MSKKLVMLHDYQIEALMAWHIDAESRAADKRNYAEAQEHVEERNILESIRKTPLVEGGL